MQIGHKIPVVDGRNKNARVVVEEDDAEVMDRADALLPVAGFGLETGDAVAEKFAASRHHVADHMDLAALADPLARTVGLVGGGLG